MSFTNSRRDRCACMWLIEHTCPEPAENLALDELLLDEAEGQGSPRECLRIWEPSEPLVVIGRSSRIADEVNLEECRQRNVPVLRRTSGGAAIVTGPGCLMYAIVLSYELRPELRAIDIAHRYVMQRLRVGLGAVGLTADVHGTCDLTVAGRKFSGNALRCRREHCLYHGTLLYDFPLETIAALLRMPPRMPEYRLARSHQAFVANVAAKREDLRAALLAGFPTDGEYGSWDESGLQRLVTEKFANPLWNTQH